MNSEVIIVMPAHRSYDQIRPQVGDERPGQRHNLSASQATTFIQGAGHDLNDREQSMDQPARDQKQPPRAARELMLNLGIGH